MRRSGFEPARRDFDFGWKGMAETLKGITVPVTYIAE